MLISIRRPHPFREILSLAILVLVLNGSGLAASEKIIHRFVSYPMGANPEGAPIMDSSGNVYQVTEFGGEYGNGSVLKTSLDAHGLWATTVIYSFKDIVLPGAGLTFDSAGNLYGITPYGGDGKWGVVYRLSHGDDGKWSAEILHSFTGENGDGAQPFGPLVFDTAGNLYGATHAGGAYGNTNNDTGGTVFELVPSSRGWSETVLYSFQSSAGEGPSSGVVLDAKGNLYGLLQPGQVFQLTYSPSAGWTQNLLCSCGSANTSLLIDAEGNLYGNNYLMGNGYVFELERANGWKQLMVYSFSGGADGSYPWQGLTFDSAGNLYGVTYFGGVSGSCFDSRGCGTVFQLAREGEGHWKHSIVYAFKSNEAGDVPNGIVIDNAGILHGTTQLGGDQGCEVNPDVVGCGIIFTATGTPDHGWQYHQVLAFSSGDGQGPEASLVADSSGNFYGTTPFGGAFAANEGGIVFKLTHEVDGNWKETILHSFGGGPHDATSPAGNLIIDSSGNLYGVTSYTAGNNKHAQGTVFKLMPKSDGTWTETRLYGFAGYSDGEIPVAGLVSDANGNLYGTTGYGGSGQCPYYIDNFGCGTVFELSPTVQGTWTETILHVFTGYPNDGFMPNASLLRDEAGNLYGSTAYGGSSAGCTDGLGDTLGCGTIFKLSPGPGGTWSETAYYTFPGNSVIRTSGLTFGPQGGLYGTTGNGGSNGAGTFYQVTAAGGSWAVDTLYNFGGQAGDGIGPNGVTFDSSNNAYGTTVSGGKANNYCTGGCGTIFELSPGPGGSWAETVVYSFHGPVSDGMWPMGGIVFDESGNMYGTTTQGEDHNWANGFWGGGTVFEVPGAGLH
jgi:uncharacterized repeat protein (TIGR03803 family)